jgi:predicted amidophosphoribosyltransferase
MKPASPDRKEHLTTKLLGSLGHHTSADPQPINIYPLCAACGREVAAYLSLCETCEQELMSQPPSWTANRL